jgi:dynein assembly factor 1
VQQNCISHVSGLEALENLDTINLSYNQLRRLDGLACCPALRTLICTNNYLTSVESIAHLAGCTGLHTLDLQNNQLSDPAILDILRQLPELRCLYLKGNPVVSAIRNYRKTIVAALPELRYLDERPVFDDERRLVTAWCVTVCACVIVCGWCVKGGGCYHE